MVTFELSQRVEGEIAMNQFIDNSEWEKDKVVLYKEHQLFLFNNSDEYGTHYSVKVTPAANGFTQFDVFSSRYESLQMYYGRISNEFIEIEIKKGFDDLFIKPDYSGEELEFNY